MLHKNFGTRFQCPSDVHSSQVFMATPATSQVFKYKHFSYIATAACHNHDTILYVCNNFCLTGH